MNYFNIFIFCILPSIILNDISSNLSIYTYPYDELTSPKQFYESLIKESIIPKEIIVKVMDIDETKTIRDKYFLIEAMSKYFKSDTFNLTWLINVSNDIKNFNGDDIINILEFLIKTIKNTKNKPLYINLDIEPIYNVKTGLNLFYFHANLIKAINFWNIPVTVYINPSVYANPEADVFKREGHKEFIEALMVNKENVVYLPAYLGGEDDIREDRILSSAKSFDELKIKYKLIVDIQNKEKLEERLKFIKNNNLLKNGLSIYRLSKEIPKPDKGVMDLIKLYLS